MFEDVGNQVTADGGGFDYQLIPTAGKVVIDRPAGCAAVCQHRIQGDTVCASFPRNNASALISIRCRVSSRFRMCPNQPCGRHSHRLIMKCIISDSSIVF